MRVPSTRSISGKDAQLTLKNRSTQSRASLSVSRIDIDWMALFMDGNSLIKLNFVCEDTMCLLPDAVPLYESASTMYTRAVTASTPTRATTARRTMPCRAKRPTAPVGPGKGDGIRVVHDRHRRGFTYVCAIALYVHSENGECALRCVVDMRMIGVPDERDVRGVLCFGACLARAVRAAQ